MFLSLLSKSNYANDTPEVDALKSMFRDAKPRYTCGILSSGGCGDSIAAVLSGFKILWGTEIDEGKRALFRDLTGAIDMGNTFDADLHECQRPQVIISGQPCTDYSTSGSRTGEGGATGWQYTQQTDLINKIRPRAFVLEMVANAKRVNGGREVQKVIRALSNNYVVHEQVVRCEHHGDSSNRERLFIVGFDRIYGDKAHRYEFPQGSPKSAKSARELAQRDDDVPERFWVTPEQWTREHKKFSYTQAVYPERYDGKIHKIAQLGEGMGHSSIPHAIYDWEGTFNTQTTYNGGGMRPPLSWKKGQPINALRKTTPTEAVRIASFPNNYESYLRTFKDSDEFVFDSVNGAVPVCTGRAIMSSVFDHLVYCDVPVDPPAVTAHTMYTMNATRDASG